MTPRFAFERRWRDELCAAVVPSVAGTGLPGWDALQTDASWERFFETAAPTLRRGFRAAVWVLTTAPLVRLRRPRLFGRLPADERDAFLVRMLEHRRYSLRQLASVLRLVACQAYFADPAVRAHVAGGPE